MTTIEGSAAGLWKILSDYSVIKVTNFLYRLWTAGPFQNESCQSQRPRGAALCSFWFKIKGGGGVVFKLFRYEERLSKQSGEVTAQDERKSERPCSHVLIGCIFFFFVPLIFLTPGFHSQLSEQFWGQISSSAWITYPHGLCLVSSCSTEFDATMSATNDTILFRNKETYRVCLRHTLHSLLIPASKAGGDLTHHQCSCLFLRKS